MFGAPYTVIGVARDAHFTRLDEREPQVFLSLVQVPELGAMERVRLVARGDNATMVKRALREAVRSVDPRLPTFQERDVAQQLDAVLMTQRFGTLLLTVFGVLSLLISAVGIYAVASYDVTRRRRELGIRAALGAQRDDLVHAVLRRSGSAVCAGVVLGLAAAAAVTHTLRGLLFGIDAYEPVSYLLAAITLGAIATAAAWLPARRAARIDPMVSLRSE
jgi:ABC-type lipoprotein release transport system permease subunit